MNKQIDRILICVLWLLAATLGTCFWLNTTFGFNIFSAQHWQYLAYLQAAQTPVRPAFYISLTCAVLIALGVLYILIRPRGIWRRHTKIHRARMMTITTPDTQQQPVTTDTANDAPPAPQNAPAQPVTTKLQRPPRIGIAPNMAHAMSGQTQSATLTQPTVNQAIFTPPQSSTTNANNINFDDLRDIFESTGYTVKHSPQIGNFKPALFAIGTNEQLWLGGVGIAETALATAMDRLATIFSDTLDDIQINIFGFIIAPSGPVSNTDIQTFSDTAELRTYMESNRNTPPSDASERENFDAYSEYIDTVINYMDKT